jgi:transaldolase
VASYSFYSIREVIAAAELGCHSVTLSPTILDELSNTNYDPSLDPGVEVLKSEIVNQNGTAALKRLQHLLSMDSLASHNFVPAPIDVDYLANGGAELEKPFLKTLQVTIASEMPLPCLCARKPPANYSLRVF